MNTEKNFALLIDADNVSYNYLPIMLEEAKRYGNVAIRRIYGDWTDCRKNTWKDILLENSIIPIQQYSYTIGKNASDSAMIIDAMDILYSDQVSGFIIVSSDSDFTRLAMRLREACMTVIGMGESKTPTAFVKASLVFKGRSNPGLETSCWMCCIKTQLRILHRKIPTRAICRNQVRNTKK
mgnify:CR=1 FL=1